MNTQTSMQEVARNVEPDDSEPDAPTSRLLMKFRTHRHTLQESSTANQAILVLFTSGLFAGVVGVASLMEPARISDHLSFRVFYPTGTILMLSILLLKFPSNVIPASVSWIKYVMQVSLMLTPVFVLVFVRLIFYDDDVLSLLIAGALFVVQLILSFTYVFFCMRDIKY